MKVVWILRRDPPLPMFDSEFPRAFENAIGKNNVVFYGRSTLPTTYPTTYPVGGNKYYPETFKLIRPLSEIIKEENPDIVVLQDKPMSTGPDDVPKGSSISRVIFLEDAHCEWHDACIPYLDRKEIDVIFTRSYGNGLAFRVKQRCQLGYCPYSVPTNIFYDRNYIRANDVYLTGTYAVIYPLREYMAFTFYKFPCESAGSFSYEGIKGISDYRRLNNEKYIESLNLSKTAIFDGGMFRYPSMKFFECMACNTLVFAQLPYDYKALRFEPNENIVEIDYTNFVEKVKEYIRDENERKRIVKNAMDLVLKYHSVEERSKQLIAQFEEVINSKNEGRTFDYRNVKGEAGRMLSIVEQDINNFNKDNLFNRCLDQGLRPPYYEWHEKAYLVWRQVISRQIPKEKWIDFVKENP